MISVIVPVYNVENYIERCINSILVQSYTDFELILVDDGSTDSSGRYCDELCQKDKRIRVIHQENQGLSVARNTGLDHMQGDYVTFIDSDDFVETDFLQHLYEKVVSNDAQISVCGYRIVEENKDYRACVKEVHTEVCDGREATYRIVRDSQEVMITAWGKLYHKSLKEWLYFPAGRLHEDEFVTYKVLYKAQKVAISLRPLYCYFQRSQSITNSSFSIRRLDKLTALKEAIAYFNDLEEEDLKCYAIKRYVLNIQIAWYRVNKCLSSEISVKKELQEEWRRTYSQNKDLIRIRCGRIDMIAIYMYMFSPYIYSIFADMIKTLFPRI